MTQIKAAEVSKTAYTFEQYLMQIYLIVVIYGELNVH